MKEVKVGIITYTYNDDGTVTRTVNKIAQAEIEQKLKDTE
jgi:hypothetical protein